MVTRHIIVFKETLIPLEIFYSAFLKSFKVYFNIENYTNDRRILSLVNLLFCQIVSARLEQASHKHQTCGQQQSCLTFQPSQQPSTLLKIQTYISRYELCFISVVVLEPCGSLYTVRMRFIIKFVNLVDVPIH